jgi:hypothetical protein
MYSFNGMYVLICGDVAAQLRNVVAQNGNVRALTLSCGGLDVEV